MHLARCCRVSNHAVFFMHARHCSPTCQLLHKSLAEYCVIVMYLPAKWNLMIRSAVYRICSCHFICALWSPAGKGLTSWLSFVVSNCEFVTFPLVSWVGSSTYIIRLLCWCAAVPVHEAYIAHTAHPVLCTHFGFKKGTGCIKLDVTRVLYRV